MKAFIFPGQGSQSLGMGGLLLEKYPEYHDYYEMANKSLGYDLKSIVYGDDEESLTLTQNAQPAILTSSYIAFRHIVDKMGIKPDFAAGHSLGEWTALVAAEVIPFEVAVKLVHLRGTYMSKACSPGKGGMAAVLGIGESEIIEALSKYPDVEIANLNTFNQIVVSGDREQLENSVESLKSAGAKRVIMLNVSGPFHSRLVEDARIKMCEELTSVVFKKPVFPIFQNYDAKPETDPAKLKEKVIKQITSSVRWVDTVDNLLKNGTEEFFEIGFGKVLTSLVKSIVKEMSVEKKIYTDNFENLLKTEIS